MHRVLSFGDWSTQEGLKSPVYYDDCCKKCGLFRVRRLSTLLLHFKPLWGVKLVLLRSCLLYRSHSDFSLLKLILFPLSLLVYYIFHYNRRLSWVLLFENIFNKTICTRRRPEFHNTEFDTTVRSTFPRMTQLPTLMKTLWKWDIGTCYIEQWRLDFNV